MFVDVMQLLNWLAVVTGLSHIIQGIMQLAVRIIQSVPHTFSACVCV